MEMNNIPPSDQPPSYESVAGTGRITTTQLSQPINQPGPSLPPGHQTISRFQVIPVQPLPAQTVLLNPPVGPTATPLLCPFCNNRIISRVDYTISGPTHIIATILCLMGAWCCVCCPYIIDSCKSGNHSCPSCGAFLGTYMPIKM